MPRVARQLVDGCIYHLLNRGNGRQRVFHRDHDYQAFIDLLAEMSQRHGVDLLAWCLMPNHYHLVVRPKVGSELSRGMQWFQTTHVRRYHRHYGTSGHLWQGRYKSFAVMNDEQLLTVVRYVEGNPVRANLVDSATGWIWSSHRERLKGTAGAGSAGACPPGQNAKAGAEGDSPSLAKGLSPLKPLPINLPPNWTQYVDTPLTGMELAKLRKGAGGGSAGASPF